MALAPFFDKAALAASQVLQGIDFAMISTILEGRAVGVAFDDEAAGTAEGRTTLDLTVNLLARLYPALTFVPTGSVADRITSDLVIMARSINPQIDVDMRAHPSALVAVGNTPVVSTAPVVYIGSTGWVARLSPERPVGCGITSNPFGAAAAACFGVANIFRLLFGAYLSGDAPDVSFALSLLDYVPCADPAAVPELMSADLGESFLVGLGAIGNAAAWVLARTPNLHGVLHLVDHESVDLSNFQRYVLTRDGDVGAMKVALVSRAFAGTQLDVRLHEARWGEYLRGRADWRLDRVAVAVDSDEDRLAIQAALPRWIVNAWTQPGDLGISRHKFDGDQACVMCLYLPDAEGKSEDTLVAEAIGLPEEKMEVRHLLYTGAPVSRRFLGQIAAALQVPLEPLLPFEGQPLRSFYTGAICGGLVLRLGGTADRTTHQAAVPLAFQSALAGIMLGAELVAHSANLIDTPPPVTTKINLLRPIAQHLSLPATKHPSGRCICQDPDYLMCYRAKYERADA